MADTAIAVVILAAGHGTRMNSSTPKVLHEIAGLSMLGHTIASAEKLSPEKTIVVVGAQGQRVSEAAQRLSPGIEIAVQDPPQGTGDAVKKAMPALEGFSGVLLVLYADTPLVTDETLTALITKAENNTVSVLGFCPQDPGAYGRLKLRPDGSLEAIIEAKDATPEELAIAMCNSGVMAIDSSFLRNALPALSSDNAKNEYYLTDVVSLATSQGLTSGVIEADSDEVLGVNSRTELAVAERIYQTRRRDTAMKDGITLIDPDTVFFSHDTIVENDVTIEPSVFFGAGVTVRSGSHVKAYSHIEGAVIGANAAIGPFARLRSGTDIGENAKVGNFVETKKAKIGPEAKVSHLSYIGDSIVGARANIGAGTITCNYDGFNKHLTEIGEDAFIGSNSALVAPVKIGDGAIIGSGSVITLEVEKDALAVARGRQAVLKGWAARFRKARGA